MISGSVSFAPGNEVLNVADVLRTYNDSDGLSFFKVCSAGLTGGYFTSPRLPLDKRDFYYCDRKRDILVLLSGYIYNAEFFPGAELPGKELAHPELIAELFLERGPGFVLDLNGDFAIYIERSSSKEAYLFRDHAGIRPLAYFVQDSSLCFSTDPVGLAKHFSSVCEPDIEYVLDCFKSIDLRRTPVKGVKKLLPGHYLSFTDGRVAVCRYWDPGKIRKDRSLTHDRMLKELRVLLDDAVKIRCDGRFTAGAHISGGLDSGIIASLARSGYPYQERFYGFSWSPAEFIADDPGHDERLTVRSFCEKKDIIPVFSDLDAGAMAAGAGSGRECRLYFAEDRVISQAAGRGVNLLFSGWGGDEFISIADRGIEIDLLRSLRFREFFKRNPVRPFRKFAKYFFIYVISPFFGILPRNVSRYLGEKSRYLKKPLMKSDRRSLRYFYCYRSRRRLHLSLLELYHIQDRCESWAVNGYRHGFEYRYPLLDKRIIEYMLKVPSELLCKTDYYRPLLREISEDILPDEIRFNWSKADHLLQSHTKKLYRETAVTLMHEVPEWKMNKNLSFIDFDLLEEDILRIGKSGTGHDAELLYRSIVFIKAVHAFTIALTEDAVLKPGKYVRADCSGSA